MKKRFAAAVLMTAALIQMPVCAAGIQPETEGYLVRVRDTQEHSVLQSGVQAVVPEQGLYWSPSLQAAEQVFGPEQIVSIESNLPVQLLETGASADCVCRQESLTLLQVPDIWQLGLDGSGVRIGIIDSGVSAEHACLLGTRILEGCNYLDGSRDTSDSMGHGTFVAGIIAGQNDAAAGFSGIAPRAEVVPLKCFDEKRSSLRAVIQAVYASVDEYDCDILNLSFGMSGSSEAFEEAVAYAAQSGTLVLASVGNSGDTELYYPAGYDSVIGIGSVNPEKQCSEFSVRNPSVFLTAPGESVFGPKGGSGYRTDSGTSYSCAEAAGVAALLLQMKPDLTVQQMSEILSSTAEDLGQPGYDTLYGYGLIRAASAARAVSDLNPPVITAHPEDCVWKISGCLNGIPAGINAFAVGYRLDGSAAAASWLTVWVDSIGRTVFEGSISGQDIVSVSVFAAEKGSLKPVQTPVTIRTN